MAVSCTLTGPPMVTRRDERTRASRVEDGHLDVVAPPEEIGHGVELAGQRVPLGVRRVAAVERAAEVAGADGLQLVGQLVGPRPGLDDGEGAAGVADDVGVGREVHAGVHGTGRGSSPRARATSAERTQRLRYHSARPSRRRIPCTIPSPVNQWYVAGSGAETGIGPVAQVAAAEGLGDLAGHGQLGRRHLLEHRAKLPCRYGLAATVTACPPSVGRERPRSNARHDHRREQR